MLNKLLIFLMLFTIGNFQFALSQTLKQDINAHDPVMIKMGETYYLYCTGKGITVWSSKDRLNWKSEPSVFNTAPDWAVDLVQGFTGYFWAPDISFFNGQYYLYYSVSTFGKNTSAIGVATNTTLDSSDPSYRWIDHGLVINSESGKTNWNAIDPNLIADNNGQAFLTFGSFWSGIKLVKLAGDRLSVLNPEKDPLTIASRNNSTNAIEAPFIFRKGSYYYLFVSIDFCCRGKNSTYKMVVGRSKSISGPYIDDKNKLLNNGGGKLLLEGNDDWYGVGHNAVVAIDNTDYLIFHGYSAAKNGAPKLLMRSLKWKNGWPISSPL